MACPSCNIVVNVDDLGIEGIVSCQITLNTPVNLTANQIYLKGPTTGNMSISGYPYQTYESGSWLRRPTQASDRLLGVGCKSVAQASCEWIQKIDCDNDIIYFIPKWGGSASIEGDVDITGESATMGNYVTLERYVTHYTNFTADASGGPATPIINSAHSDGFNLIYTGLPIPIQSGRPQAYTGILSSIFPEGQTTFYLSSFNLSIEPPFSSRVSYNFIFRYNLL